MDYVINALGCKIEEMPKPENTEILMTEADYIYNYLYSTISSNHRITSIYKITQSNNDKNFNLNNFQNRYIFCHGTKPENILGILSQGLKKTGDEYFRKYNQKYDVGAYLVYTYEKGNYFCRIAEFIPSSKKYRIKQVSGSFTGIVSERDIVLVDAYHFINTEGVICTTYIGKNKMRDRWLSLTGNMFRNKKDAIAKWEKINGCNYND